MAPELAQELPPPTETPLVTAPNPLSESERQTVTVEAGNVPVAGEEPAGVAPAGRRVNLATLIVALVTMLITMALLLIVQIRILPRTTLVHNMLWAVIVGWIMYILYGVGIIPGADWIYAHLDVWGAGLVAFVGMILPLLWLQLRSN